MEPPKEKRIARPDDIASNVGRNRLASLRPVLIEQEVKQQELCAAHLRQVMAGFRLTKTTIG